MNEIRIGKWKIRLPRNRIGRIFVGVLLVILGFFGFLPVLGFWMIPLGLAILSYDIPAVRRLRRKFVIWSYRVIARRFPALAEKLGLPKDNGTARERNRNPGR